MTCRILPQFAYSTSLLSARISGVPFGYGQFQHLACITGRSKNQRTIRRRALVHVRIQCFILPDRSRSQTYKDSRVQTHPSPARTDIKPISLLHMLSKHSG
jgi:hypothetical protein